MKMSSDNFLSSISFKLLNNISYILYKNSFPASSVLVELKRLKKSKNNIEDFDDIFSLLLIDYSEIISFRILFVSSNNSLKYLLSALFSFEEFLMESIRHLK
jgi:hypothetical protein